MTEVWPTYAQPGERFGLTSDAMRMRAPARLAVAAGERRRTLILVPDDRTFEPRARSPAGSPERTAEQSGVISGSSTGSRRRTLAL